MVFSRTAILLLFPCTAAGLSVANPKFPHPHVIQEVVGKVLKGQELSQAVQSTAKEHEESCQCLNWKEVYAADEYRLECGDGLEMFTYANGKGDESTRLKALHSKNGQKMCHKFFEKLNNNYCVNVGQHNTPDAWHGGQWCYVDSHKCGRLNGGMHVSGSQVSWKLCNEKDSRLRESSVEDLTVLSKVDDVDLALLTKMAYRVHEDNYWWQVQGAWDVFMGRPKADAHTLVEAPMLSAMQTLQGSQEPMVFLNTKQGMPPFGVVVGNKAYEIQKNFKGNETLPGTFNKAVCINGCNPWGW